MFELTFCFLFTHLNFHRKSKIHTLSNHVAVDLKSGFLHGTCTFSSATVRKSYAHNSRTTETIKYLIIGLGIAIAKFEIDTLNGTVYLEMIITT